MKTNPNEKKIVTGLAASYSIPAGTEPKLEELKVPQDPETIRQKLLDMIDEMENKQYDADTILSTIKNRLKFNKFMEE